MTCEREGCQNLIIKKRRFCSLSCANKARPHRRSFYGRALLTAERTCQECLEGFFPKTGNQKFCSIACAEEGRRKWDAARKRWTRALVD